MKEGRQTRKQELNFPKSYPDDFCLGNQSGTDRKVVEITSKKGISTLPNSVAAFATSAGVDDGVDGDGNGVDN